MEKLYLGDCLDVLKTLPENSVDSIVTDPPAGISFMSKGWDSDKGGRDNWIEWMSNIAKECLRVLKPGGHAFVWALPRTTHWTATAWENGGFEPRDVVAHVFGSGFPKSHNIEKAVQKIQPEKSNEFKGIGTALKPAREDWWLMRKPLEKGLSIAENCLKYGTGGINIDESRVEHNEPEVFTNRTAPKSTGEKMGIFAENGKLASPNQSGRFPANLLHDNSEEVRECFPESVSKQAPRGGQGFHNAFGRPDRERLDGEIPKGHNDSGNASRFFKSIPQDLHCSLCYDTIKVNQLTKNICSDKNNNVPSVEKSFTNTQATKENTALKNATGKVNENLVQNVKSAGNLCDLCGTSIAQRLVAIMQDQSQESTLGELSMPEHKKQILEKCLVSFVELMGNTDTIPTMENLNLLFGYVSNAIDNYTQNCEDIKGKDKSHYKSLIYQSKASKSERNKGCEELETKDAGASMNSRCATCGKQKLDHETSRCKCEVHIPAEMKSRDGVKNNHPTVKPTALMSYLIKMITPKGGIVLDPFAGSGSTLVAAKENGFGFIGIELTPEYIPIIEARVGVKAETIGQEVEVEEDKSIIEPVKVRQDRCSCGGRIVKTKSGVLTCEDCFETY